MNYNGNRGFRSSFDHLITQRNVVGHEGYMQTLTLSYLDVTSIQNDGCVDCTSGFDASIDHEWELSQTASVQ